MAEEKAKTRLAWLDQVRAVGIVLVVLGHAIMSAERSGLSPASSWAEVGRAIYSFHMPLFFLLAGITHALAGKRGPRQAVSGLFWSIVVPYFLWSTIWFVLKSAFAGAANRAVEVSPIDIIWHPVDHFWFLYVLLIVRAGWYLVDATGSSVLRWLAVIVPLGVAAWGAGPSQGVMNIWLLFWAAFYGVGIVLTPVLPLVSRPALAGLAIALWANWLWILISHPQLLKIGFDIWRKSAALAGALGTVALVAVLELRGTAGRWLAFLGEASLTIFLTHTIFGAAVRVLLARLNILTPETLIVAATVAGIVLPIMFHLAVLWAGQRLQMPLMRWCGLGTASGSRYVSINAGGLRTASPG